MGDGRADHKRPRVSTGLVVLVLNLAACSAPPPPRSAVLIVLDTLRADRLSAYGNQRQTSPVIDGLAERGVLFESVVSNAPWTLPAMVGLLSGTYPSRAEYHDELRRSLVSTLREAGWQTAAFTGGGLAGAEFGVDLGFDHFQEQDPSEMALLPPGRRPARKTASESAGVSDIDSTFSAARSWLDENHRDPFFLMIHTYEPHTPYRRSTYAGMLDRGALPPTLEVRTAAQILAGKAEFEVGSTELAYIRALYDGGVTESDRQVGALLAHLESLDLADDTLIVVTADHGEDLGERDPPTPGNHGHGLWDPQLLVPLVVFDPTRDYPVERVATQVRLVDTMPTILELLGVEEVAPGEGRSLVPLMNGEPEPARLAWAARHAGAGARRQVEFALRSSTHKLLAAVDSDRIRRETVTLYDLASEPGERTNVAQHEPERVEEMLQVLETLHQQQLSSGLPNFDLLGASNRAALRRLRELGYLD